MPNEETLPTPKIISTSRPDEGSVKGEGWAFLRAFSVLILAVMVLGYLLTA